jgi:hypothetical protein
MAHIPPNPESGGGLESRRDRRPLGVCRRYQSPHLVILSRASRPPVPQLVERDEQEKADDVVASVGGGIKREIRGMSSQSSLNLARLLSILDWSKHGQCVHVTLTYAKVFPLTKEELAEVKAAMVRDIGRHVECGIWRLEFQKRGAPHWHLLLWIGNRDAAEFEWWLRGWWAKFSGNASEHGSMVTSGDQTRARWYIAMHAAKREQSIPFPVGRWWGYVQRDKLLSASDIDSPQEITERERVWWARLYRRFSGAKTRHEAGFSWFLPRAAQCAVSVWIQGHVDWERATRYHGQKPF